MNGFLTGLVQRGASMPARAAEPPGPGASIASGDSAYALEAPPELVDAQPRPPIATPRDMSAQTESVSAPAVRDAVEPSPLEFQITQVIAPQPSSTSRDAMPAPSEHEEKLEAQPQQRAESVVILEQSETRAPQLLRQIETRVEPPLSSPPIVEAARPIAATPLVDMSQASHAPPAELEIVRPSSPHIEPLEIASHTARAPEVPEVTLAPARAALLELPRSTSPTASSMPTALPIHVRIGTVEVRPAAPAPVPPPSKNASAPPALGFAAYRRVRTYRM